MTIFESGGKLRILCFSGLSAIKVQLEKLGSMKFVNIILCIF